MRLLVILALIGVGLAVFGRYVGYYLMLWTHSGTTGLVTIGVFVLYAALLIAFRPARRFLLAVLNVITLGMLGVAISRLDNGRA